MKRSICAAIGNQLLADSWQHDFISECKFCCAQEAVSGIFCSAHLLEYASMIKNKLGNIGAQLNGPVKQLERFGILLLLHEYGAESVASVRIVTIAVVYAHSTTTPTLCASSSTWSIRIRRFAA